MYCNSAIVLINWISKENMVATAPDREVARLPAAEAPASREKIIESFNRLTYKLQTEIGGLHQEIDPFTEIEELPYEGRTPITDEQKEKFAQFKMVERGVRALTGSEFLALPDHLKKETITVSLKDPVTGESLKREEGLNVRPVIDWGKKAIEQIKGRLAEPETFPETEERLKRELEEYESNVRTLEENSTPYPEVFPNALDESDPVERARIDKEEGRFARLSLTQTGSREGDKQAAIEYLRNSRLLFAKKGAEKPKVKPWEPRSYFHPDNPNERTVQWTSEQEDRYQANLRQESAVVETPIPTREPAIIQTEPVKPTIVGSYWEKQPVVEKPAVVESEGVTGTAKTPTHRVFIPAVYKGSNAGSHEVEPKRSYPHPDSGVGGTDRTLDRGDRYRADINRESASKTPEEYKSILKKLVDDLRKSGSTNADAAVEKLRDLGREVRESIPDPKIAARIDKLITIKIPVPELRRRYALIAAAALLALAAAGISPVNANIPVKLDSRPPASTSVPQDQSIAKMPEAQYEPNFVAPVISKTSSAPTPPFGNEQSLQPSPAAPAQTEEGIDPNNFGKGKIAESMYEVEIGEDGKGVRETIKEELKKVSPDADPDTIEQAASVMVWKAIADNPQLADNPDLVHPGDKFKLPDTLGGFMRGFDPNDPETIKAVQELNNIPDTPQDKVRAGDMAQSEYYRAWTAALKNN